MKISFKLDLVQLARARAIVLKNGTFTRDVGEVYHDAGNVGGLMLHHTFHFNTDQRLLLEDGTLIYEGQRCPFHSDGLEETVKVILTGVKNPKAGWWDHHTPKEYKTSDIRLAWHQTHEHWCLYTDTPAQLVDSAERRSADSRYPKDELGLIFTVYLHRKRDVMAKRLPDFVACCDLIATGRHWQANASYDRETISLARRLFRVWKKQHIH